MLYVNLNINFKLQTNFNFVIINFFFPFLIKIINSTIVESITVFFDMDQAFYLRVNRMSISCSF